MMNNHKIQISEIVYNPVESQFEAVVTFHDQYTHDSYACALSAPMNTNYEAIAAGLISRAESRHMGQTPGLRMHYDRHTKSAPLKLIKNPEPRRLPLLDVLRRQLAA